jgi:hypothetical protein
MLQVFQRFTSKNTFKFLIEVVDRKRKPQKWLTRFKIARFAKPYKQNL